MRIPPCFQEPTESNQEQLTPSTEDDFELEE
jgi:hypothetical protein